MNLITQPILILLCVNDHLNPHVTTPSACNEPMHAVMMAWVEGVGGRYDKGPLKTMDRVLEKVRCHEKV